MKKSIIILSSLILFSCNKSESKKNNSNDNIQDTTDIPEQISPEIKPIVEPPMDNLPPDYVEIPEKPIPEVKPDVKPDIKPQPEVKPDPNANYLLKFFDNKIAKYKIQNISTHYTNDINDFNTFYTLNKNNFSVTVEKVALNTLIFKFEGRIDLDNDKKEPAYIDCSNKTIQKVYFNKEGIKPNKIETLENGCKYTNNLLSPLINYDSFKLHIMTMNYTFIYDDMKDPNHTELPDLYQTISFKLSDTISL